MRKKNKCENIYINWKMNETINFHIELWYEK